MSLSCLLFFFLTIRRPPRSTLDRSSAASDVYKRQDVSLPGMVWGAVLRSPHAHARILGIDAGAALRMPGVLAVVTAEDFLASPEGEAAGGEAQVSLAGLPPALFHLLPCPRADQGGYRGAPASSKKKEKKLAGGVSMEDMTEKTLKKKGTMERR